MNISPITDSRSPEEASPSVSPENPTGNDLIEKIFADMDITGSILGHITVQEPTKVARVNTVFFKVIKDKWKKELSGKQIAKFLKKEATGGNVNGVRFLMHCDKFNEVPAEGPDGLGGALIMAVKKEHVDVIEELKTHPKFDEIPPAKDRFGLGHALIWTASKGQLKILQALKGCKNFRDIPLNGQFGLWRALDNAIGHVNVIKELKTYPNFKNIPATGKFGLGRILTGAAIEDRSDAIKELKSWDKFKDIPADGEYGLGHALSCAASNGHLRAIEALKGCDQFKDIPANGENGLRAALDSALKNRRHEVVTALRSYISEREEL